MSRPRGRPRLSDDEVRFRVVGYCTRWCVQPPPDGECPPYPGPGMKYTPQHREWLAVYRLLKRRRDSRLEAFLSREA